MKNEQKHKTHSQEGIEQMISDTIALGRGNVSLRIKNAEAELVNADKNLGKTKQKPQAAARYIEAYQEYLLARVDEKNKTQSIINFFDRIVFNKK